MEITFVLFNVAEAKPKKEPQKPAAEGPIDVSRLDMRVGCIVNAKKHPDADSLYVEDVDLGEGRLRTVISGLVRHIPLEEVRSLNWGGRVFLFRAICAYSRGYGLFSGRGRVFHSKG